MHHPDPTEDPWLSADAACARLGVQKATLYAYVSRGLVRSAPARADGAGRRRVYSHADIERLRARRDARSGHGAVAAGALRWGEPVLDSSISRIAPEGPVYRGRPAGDLVDQSATFEEVAALLLQRPWVKPRASGRPPIPASATGVTTRLGFALQTLATKDVEPSAESIVRHCTAGLATVAAHARLALHAPSTAHALLAAYGVRATAPKRRLVNRALVWAAEHELNVSSFAARVVASTGAATCVCLTAANAALSGPRHGGETERFEALLDETGSPDQAAPTLRARRQRGDLVTGFSHPLYPAGDPRAASLLEAVASDRKKRSVTLRSVVEAAASAGEGAPNLDVGLVATRVALGLPRGGALALFAIGRLAGWIAHVEEQRTAPHLLRPRARYTGP
jgi:citrate synthase